MVPNIVVVQFKDKTVTKGKTNDFFPNKAIFHLIGNSGETTQIAVEDLKAIFFVKNMNGDKDRKDNYSDDISGGGRKIQVRFKDGETIIGYTLGYSPDRQGFFMTPADLKGNNERIFVVKSATEKIEFVK